MDHIDRVVSAEYGPRSTLERRDVEQISSNSFEVRYSLHDDSRAFATYVPTQGNLINMSMI